MDDRLVYLACGGCLGTDINMKIRCRGKVSGCNDANQRVRDRQQEAQKKRGIEGEKREMSAGLMVAVGEWATGVEEPAPTAGLLPLWRPG